MIEFEIDGRLRGFKFGTYTFKIINELTGTKTIEDVQKALTENSITFLTSLFFACAKHYAMTKKQEIDFTEVDVSDWLDDKGLAWARETMNTLMETYTLKNAAAPAMGQQALQSSNGKL